MREEEASADIRRCCGGKEMMEELKKGGNVKEER